MTEAEFLKSLTQDLDVITFAVGLMAVTYFLTKFFKD